MDAEALAQHERDLAWYGRADGPRDAAAGARQAPAVPGEGSAPSAPQGLSRTLPQGSPAASARADRGAPYHPTSSTQERSPADRGAATAGPAQAGPQVENRQMMTHNPPHHREMLREAIGHHLDGAEMHAQMRDALPMEHVEHRALHRDLSAHSLKHADELHDHLTRMYGAEMPADGMVREKPAFLKTKDEGGDEGSEELSREFRRVAAKVGRVPQTVAAVCRDVLGVKAGQSIRSQLAALRDDADEAVSLRQKVSADEEARERDRVERLIEEYSAAGKAVITPARAAEMRGVDPATRQPNGRRWSEGEVRDYIARRAPGGPVAEVRQGNLQQVQPGAGSQNGAGGAQQYLQQGVTAALGQPGALLLPPPSTQQAPHFPGLQHIRSAPVDLVSQELAPEQVPLAIRAYNQEWAAKSGGVASAPVKVKDIYGAEVQRLDSASVPAPADEAVEALVRAAQEGRMVFGDLTSETAKGFKMMPLNGR